MKPLSVAPSTPVASWDVAEVVEALTAANHEFLAGRQRALGRHKLPSREVLEEIVVDLRAVLFPAHFGATEVSDDGIRHYVAQRLDAALTALQEQARRGLFVASADLATETGRPARAAPSRWGGSWPRCRTGEPRGAPPDRRGPRRTEGRSVRARNISSTSSPRPSSVITDEEMVLTDCLTERATWHRPPAVWRRNARIASDVPTSASATRAA